MLWVISPVVKILFPLMLVVASAFFLHKRFGKTYSTGLCILVIMFALTANWTAGFVPSLRDKVMLMALGEKSEDAYADEVVFDGYTIDGETFENGKSLAIYNGKWFWSGESYAWRNETDTRQPEGTTRSVTVGIPVGEDRTLNFQTNVWHGKVEISANGETWTVDTYSATDGVLDVPVGASSVERLALNQARRLVVYVAVLLGLYGIAMLLWRQMLRDPAWAKRNVGKMVYGGVALFAFFMLEKNAGNQSLWADELIQLEGARLGIKSAVMQNLQMIDATPPLYSIAAAIWYGIAPYGEQWLLLVSTVPAGLATFVMGLTGERLAGRPGGVLGGSIGGLFDYSVAVCGT